MKLVLTYSCATWRLTRKDEEKLDSFHQKQNISLAKDIPTSSPIPTYTNDVKHTQAHFSSSDYVENYLDICCNLMCKLLLIKPSHIHKRLRSTIEYIPNDNIKRTFTKVPSFLIKALKNFEDLQHVHELA